MRKGTFPKQLNDKRASVQVDPIVSLRKLAPVIVKDLHSVRLDEDPGGLAGMGGGRGWVAGVPLCHPLFPTFLS